MQALVVCGDDSECVRFVADHPDPTAAPGEVLIRVALAGICATDLEVTRGYMHFAGVLGHEFVGTVCAGPDELLGRRVAVDELVTAVYPLAQGVEALAAAARPEHIKVLLQPGVA